LTHTKPVAAFFIGNLNSDRISAPGTYKLGRSFEGQITTALQRFTGSCAANIRQHIVPMECINLLLVTAHPDDEAMFFAPTLHKLQQQGTTIHILCLSTGELINYTSSGDKSLVLDDAHATAGAALP
jgi:hypothetical protein